MAGRYDSLPLFTDETLRFRVVNEMLVIIKTGLENQADRANKGHLKMCI